MDATQTAHRFRRFSPGDVEAMQAIRRAAFAPVFASFRGLVGEPIAAIAFADADAEQARLLDEICAEASGHDVFVVAFGERVIGFASCKLDFERGIGEIGLNAIDPDCAGKGAGAWMYEKILAFMKERGMRIATVGTGGDASHAPARRAYRKAGFGPAIPSEHLYRLL